MSMTERYSSCLKERFSAPAPNSERGRRIIVHQLRFNSSDLAPSGFAASRLITNHESFNRRSLALSGDILKLTSPSTSPNELNTTLTPHSIIHGDACFAYFNKIWGIPGGLCISLWREL